MQNIFFTALGCLILTTLASAQEGFLAFESNRTGNWEIFAVNLDGSNERAISEDGADNRDARITQNGMWILWVKRDGRLEEIWRARPDGSEAGVVVENGYDPQELLGGRLLWSRRAGGGGIEVVSAAFDAAKAEVGEEELVFDATRLKAVAPIQFASTPHLDALIFWSPNPRGINIVDVVSGAERHVQRGCSPKFMPDGVNYLWTRVAGTFGIARHNFTGEEAVLYVVPQDEAWSHGYFPYLSPDYRWLVYTACPKGQHNQEVSNYLLYVQRFEDGRAAGSPRRLTNHAATDRRPMLWTPEIGRFWDQMAAALQRGEALDKLVAGRAPGVDVPVILTNRKRADLEAKFDFSRLQADQLQVRGDAKADDEGLRFHGDGAAILTHIRSAIMRAIFERDELCVELALHNQGRGPRAKGAILAWETDHGEADFILMQNQTYLEVFFRKALDQAPDRQKPVVRGKLPRDGFNHVIVTFTDGRVRLFINGKRVDQQAIETTLAPWSDESGLSLGNRLKGGSGWVGTISTLALSNFAVGDKAAHRLYSESRRRFLK